MRTTGLAVCVIGLAGLGVAACGEQEASAPESPATALSQSPTTEVAGEFTILKTATEDLAISGATDGTSFLPAITTGSPELVKSRLVTAPSTLGSIYSTKKEGDNPLVAFDGTNYLLIWTDVANGTPPNVLGRRVSTSGAAVGSLVHVTTSADVVTHCGLAFGGGKYVVTYIRNDGRLWRRLVSTAGQPLGPAKAVSTGPAACFYISHVATDGTDFLATWLDWGNKATVMARLVRGDGTFGAERTVDSSPNDSQFPVAAAFNGGKYFVMWGDRISNTRWDIYGRLMTASGGLSGARFTVQTSTLAKYPGPVVASGNNFAVGYMDDVGHPVSATMKVRFFDGSGAALSAAQTLFQASGGKVPIVGYMHATGSSFFFLVNRTVPGANAYDYSKYTGADLSGSFKTLTP